MEISTKITETSYAQTYRELREGDVFMMLVRSEDKVSSKVGIKVGKVDGDYAFLDVEAGFLSSIDPDCKVEKVVARLFVGGISR